MINRSMVRTRVIQTLYAHYEDEGQSMTEARKQLLRSFSDSYTLYHLFLLLPDAVARYAQECKEEGEKKAKAMHSVYEPEKNLISNRLLATLDGCNALRNYADKMHLSWDAGHSLVSDLYNRILADERYADYRNLEAPSFDEDKAIWRHIFSTILPQSEAIEDALEELELRMDGANWSQDAEIILTYVVKTIRKAEEGEELQLLEMFDSEDELKFATDLLTASIEMHPESDLLIEQHLKGWEKERVAKMDRIIMETAIAEIKTFPEIALRISLNEYIELSKTFCSDRSYQFVNGCLTEIVKKLNIIHKQPC